MVKRKVRFGISYKSHITNEVFYCCFSGHTHYKSVVVGQINFENQKSAVAYAVN